MRGNSRELLIKPSYDTRHIERETNGGCQGKYCKPTAKIMNILARTRVLVHR